MNRPRTEHGDGMLNGSRNAFTALAVAPDRGTGPLGDWARFREDDDGNTALAAQDTVGFASLYPPYLLSRPVPV